MYSIMNTTGSVVDIESISLLLYIDKLLFLVMKLILSIVLKKLIHIPTDTSDACNCI